MEDRIHTLLGASKLSSVALTTTEVPEMSSTFSAAGDARATLRGTLLAAMLLRNFIVNGTCCMILEDRLRCERVGRGRVVGCSRPDNKRKTFFLEGQKGSIYMKKLDANFEIPSSYLHKLDHFG